MPFLSSWTHNLTAVRCLRVDVGCVIYVVIPFPNGREVLLCNKPTHIVGSVGCPYHRTIGWQATVLS